MLPYYPLEEEFVRGGDKPTDEAPRAHSYPTPTVGGGGGGAEPGPTAIDPLNCPWKTQGRRDN